MKIILKMMLLIMIIGVASCVAADTVPPKYPEIPEPPRPVLRQIPKADLECLKQQTIDDLLYNDHALKNWGAKMEAMIKEYNEWRKEQELDLSTR